jgi:hypothetical protein
LGVHIQACFICLLDEFLQLENQDIHVLDLVHVKLLVNVADYGEKTLGSAEKPGIFGQLGGFARSPHTSEKEEGFVAAVKGGIKNVFISLLGNIHNTA